MPFFDNTDTANKQFNVIATLYKKLVGFANTNSNTSIGTEIPVSASPFVLADSVATQSVPSTGVPDTTFINKRIGFTLTAPITYNGFNISYYGVDNGLRCAWTSNQHIVYYSNLILKGIITNPNNSFLYKNVDENILNRAIDENASKGEFKYQILVEKNIGSNTWIPVSKSDYIFDRDAGVLTVYEANSVITQTNPPRISFWRYEGTVLSETNVNDPGTGSGITLPVGMNNGDILYADGNGGIGFESELKYDSTTNILTISGEKVLTQYDVNYETTEWVYKNLIDAPPQVSSSTADAPSTNTITCKWSNFDRKKIGFSTSALPNVSALNIDIIDGSGTRLSGYPLKITSGIEDVSGTLLIDTLRIIKGSGSNGPSGNIYTVYIPLTTKTPLNVDIWYSNNLDKTYKLNYNSLSFAAAGTVAVPSSITLSASGKTTGTYNISLSGLSADSADSSIKYTQSSVTIKPISSYKYGYNTTGVTISASDTITGSDTSTSAPFTGLIPGTTYQVHSVIMTNQLNNTGTTTAFTSSFTTSDPTIPTINYINSKTTVNTTMFNTYQNTGIYSGNTQITGTAYIMNKDTATGDMNITDIYLHTTSNYGNKFPDTNIAKFVIDVSDNQSIITYKSFPTLQPTVTNDTVIDISGYAPTADANISDGSGYVLQSSFKYKIKGGVLNASSLPYSLNIKQQTTINGNTFSDLNSNSYTFYVDDLSSTTKASFVTDTGYNVISDINNNLLVCGVPLNDGNWSFKLANVKTQNHIRYFNTNNILQYTFANRNTNTTIVSTYTGTIPGDSNGTLIVDTNGLTLNSPSQDSQLRYKGYITAPTSLKLYANSINIGASNNQGSTSIDIPVIITKNTADRFSQIHPVSTPITSSSGSTGKRMMTITSGSVDMKDSTKLGLNSTYQDYSGCRITYDNTKLLTASVGQQTGYCELQMIEGNFLTRAYTGTGSGIAYTNYSTLTTSTVNYSNIATEIGYRWATFKWQINGSASSVLNGCKFVISGITTSSSNTPVTLYTDANNDGLYFNNTKQKRIRVLYRTEDMIINDGIPSDIQNQASSNGNLSSVWLDATRQNTDNTFGQSLGVYSQSGLLAGGTASPAISSGSVTLNANIPALSKTVNMYTMIGLPMNTDIAFSDIKCYTQAGQY